ncbi:hypothetical protein QUF61_15070 [Candidatus Venteria ishoeyi]|uniref:hypothetical protein n=1 Tax=Candidatus Venteria ishoeyi TaxID=1899563 RepID=UPI0025A4D3AC|nr:hypothetical protein [Candidatus Venteria ishoeyi]MDM8547811.1 hypothetical protein [Candidatus Venteria ishoeyi]
MNELVFLLEEPSARAMLEGLLPKIIPQDTFVRYLVFEGKQELKKLSKGRYQKISGSRAIGKLLTPDNIRSDSFRNLVTGIRKISTLYF